RLRRIAAHAVEPVPGDRAGGRVPAEHRMALEGHLAVLLLDVVGDDEHSADRDPAGDPADGSSTWAPGGRLEALLAHPRPGEAMELAVIVAGARHLHGVFPPVGAGSERRSTWRARRTGERSPAAVNRRPARVGGSQGREGAAADSRWPCQRISS